jgi:2-keto-3-deoxy-L-rhamnonate aldolase RhmA
LEDVVWAAVPSGVVVDVVSWVGVDMVAVVEQHTTNSTQSDVLFVLYPINQLALTVKSTVNNEGQKVRRIEWSGKAGQACLAVPDRDHHRSPHIL